MILICFKILFYLFVLFVLFVLHHVFDFNKYKKYCISNGFLMSPQMTLF